jgi:putative ABC transport system permease protein
MLRVALRGIAARRMRTFNTALAIALGVMLIAGTYVLTDTINSSFGKIFEEGAKGTDVAVVPKTVVEDENGAGPPPLDARLLETVEGVDGVQKAEGEVFNVGSVFGKDGDRLGVGGAPNFVVSADQKPFSPFNYVQGRPPANRNEAALDELTADKEGFRVGDRIKIGGAGGARTYDLVGIAKYGTVSSFGGAVISILTLPEAQRALDYGPRFDTIAVQAAPGTTRDQLKADVRAAIPPSEQVIVRTGEEQAQANTDDITDDLGFLRIALLVFAGIAVFVGAFQVFNTFSITVAQRTREFALLRTLGASRAQVLRSVITESLVIGVLASAAGVALGIGLAPALNALFKSLGLDLPNQGIVIRPRTIIVAMLVGTLMTLIAGILPALRATRVDPVAALREGAVLPPGRLARYSLPLAILVTVAGVAALAIGLFGGASGSGAAALLGLGAALMFLGVALISPRLVGPLAGVIGLPLRRFGMPGVLARENAVRQPGRTAATAAALMIGLALVSFVTIFAAGIKDSIESAVAGSLKGQLIVQNTDGFSPFSAGAAREIATTPGVTGTAAVQFTQAETVRDGNRERVSITGVEPARMGDLYQPKEWKGGADSYTALAAPGGFLAQEDWADDRGLEVGDPLPMLTPTGKRVTYQLRGLYDDPAYLQQVTIATPQVRSEFGERKDSTVFVKVDGNVADVQDELEQRLDQRFPDVEALTFDEFKDKQAGQIQTLLTLIYSLLSLAVIVSLFGIANTLSLSIHERTRELGLLRAIGTSRRQVRRMVRYEAVITALIGAVLGTILGAFFAVIVSRPLADEGFVLSFPVGTLIVLLILAALAGVLAAIGPARRASRMDVLEALAYE